VLNDPHDALPKPEPIGANGSVKVSAGPWDFQYYSRTTGSQKELGLRVLMGAGSKTEDGTTVSGLKGGITLRMEFENLRVAGQVPISGGRVQDTKLSFNGLRQIAVDMQVGSREGLKDNLRDRLEIPFEIPLSQSPVTEIGLRPTLKFKVIVKFGFSSKNTTANGTVAYTIAGDIGTSPAQPVGDPINFFDGLSMAPFGIVYAFEVKFTMGIGLPGMSAGPYLKLVLSFGYANSGQMGAVRCQNLSGSATGSYGVGADVSATAAKVLTALFGKGNYKMDAEEQLNSSKLWDSPHLWADPDSKFCRNEG
jgi:hypothetical protein